MDDRALIRTFEGFHNRRFLAITAAALVAFAIVLIALIAGVRHSHLDVAKSSNALTNPVPHQPRAPAPPPAIPVK